MGDAYFKKGLLDEALTDFSAVINMKPSYYNAYLYRGITLARQGKSQLTLADLKKAIALSPYYVETAYLQRGGILGKLGELDRALADFNRVIDVNPGFWQARLLRGMTYEQKRDYRRAIEDYEKTIELKPEGYRAYNNLAWLLATCPRGSYRDGTRVVKLAQTALNLNPHAYVLDTLAAAWTGFGR